MLAVDSYFFAGLYLAADVDFRGGIVADQNDGQAGAVSGSGHGFDFGGDFGADIAGDFCAVKDTGWHSGSRVLLGFDIKILHCLVCDGETSREGQIDHCDMAYNPET